MPDKSKQRFAYWCGDQPPDRPPDKPTGSARLTNLSRMAPAQKQKLWQNVQQDNPPLAQLLKSPEFQALRDAFNADILVSLDDLYDKRDPNQPTRGN